MYVTPSAGSENCNDFEQTGSLEAVLGAFAGSSTSLAIGPFLEDLRKARQLKA